MKIIIDKSIEIKCSGISIFALVHFSFIFCKVSTVRLPKKCVVAALVLQAPVQKKTLYIHVIAPGPLQVRYLLQSVTKIFLFILAAPQTARPNPHTLAP